MNCDLFTAVPVSNEDEDSKVQPTSPRQRLLGFAFRIYKIIVSPVLHAVAPSRCLYVPTCSEYAYIAMSRYGMMRGSWMALKRFARCHPWGRGGLDPVPERGQHGVRSESVSRHPNSEPPNYLS
jgi:putative membrane protein insertion efficiency factor